MSHHQQSAQSFIIADPLEFARRGMKRKATFELAGFARLVDVLTDTAGSVHVTVEAWQEEGDRFLVLAIEAAPNLQCQRCLGAMSWPLDITAKLLLIAPGEPLPDEDLEEDDFDPIVAERDLDVRALVEEELLLALPIAPRHDDCESPQPCGEDDGTSSFAALAQLRDAGGKEN